MSFEKGETSSSSISLSKSDYEVFLSFRGPDTRQGFTNCLYHALIDSGISVFMDDVELPMGSKINEILTALDNSQICIVVLSPGFAASAWCLSEVERMVDRKKDIVPIFYRVTPDAVKLKTKRYTKALTKHETKYGEEQVQRWSESLKNIPTIKGRELKDTGYIEFTRQIAKEILVKLKVNNKSEIKNLVEVPNEVQDAMELLEIGSSGRRFVGIHGMGGIGKTTLARIIFNRISDKFDCSCFLENVRDYSSRYPDGLHKLQDKLLKSLDPSMDNTHSVDPMKWIKKSFQRKKVLIVLDDVDKQTHLDSLVGDSSWFGSGSRIIFTSRNAELHEQGTSSDAELHDERTSFYGLEKKVMDSKQARKLFSRHAFREDSPPIGFESLSDEAISTTGRLPLALELVGSLLHRRDAKFWKDVIEKWKEAPHQDVQASLKISYDALAAEQKEIFLDIACFFIGQEKANAVYMWEACKFYPNEGIEVLINMSLVKLTENECFWMHDQLRDFGRAIVKVNSEDARAGSRLWMQKDALDLLKRNEGKEKVEAIHLSSGSLDRENFVGLEKLRYLRMTNSADLGGDFGGLIPNLRWLSLLDASSFTVFNLCLRKLVVLELSWCSFNETWQGWGQILILEQLKVLYLSACRKLTSMPDMSKLVNLERLALTSCNNLTSIHSSIGKLQCLSHLMISTTVLAFHLPESIGSLVSLTILQVHGVGNLPNSIGELVKLKHLSLKGSKNLRVLPDSIGDLKLLISLDLEKSGVTELPSTIGRLAKLESLRLAECKMLQRLPDSIGNLHLLIDLNMSYSSIVQLPHSFGNLHSLIDLNMSYSSIIQLPHSFGNLHSLIDLNMSDTDIVELPHSFGNLVSLQKLNLKNSKVTSLPDSFRDLEKLESLVIGLMDCNEEWNQLPNGLTQGGKKILNFSGLFNLSHLEIEYYGSMGSLVLEGMGQLIKLKLLYIRASSVRSLSMQQAVLRQLKSLTLHCASLEFGQCRLPWSLESLDLRVKEWGQLPINLFSMKNLSMLELWNFVIDKEDSFEGLESLEYISLTCCLVKFKDFPVLKSLRKLVLFYPREFQFQLSKLKKQSELKLINFPMHEVKEMDQCTISEFPNNVSVLKSLTSLRIRGYDFPKMTCLHIQPQLNCLIELDIIRCSEVVYIQGFGKLKSLKKLQIRDCRSLRKIGDLFKLKGPVSIDISSCNDFEGIDGVDRLGSTGTLSYLSIWGCKCQNLTYGTSWVKYGS